MIYRDSSAHRKSIALMRWLSKAAKSMGGGVAKNTFVVGGAIRNFVIDRPIKDIDVVIDSIVLKRDSDWFAKQLQSRIPVETTLETNQYGVAILSVKGTWIVEGLDLTGEVIEIANARSESYGGTSGKGYKPDTVLPATIQDDMKRREFTFNTLMWRLSELADGPDKAEILDLTGCGISDLKNGVMACPSDPDKTFSDDPTRMLRAIKFLSKYGFKIRGDVAKSIRKNAKKIRNAPSSAISGILLGTILSEPTYKKALLEMDRLGLLSVIADMIREDKSFRATMENWVSNKKVSFMFDLMDVGLPLSTRTSFLDKRQLDQLRKAVLGMPEGHPEEFLSALKQVGRAIKDKKFLPELAKERGLTGKQLGPFMSLAQQQARDLLLSNPDYFYDAPHFRYAIKRSLSSRTSSAPMQLHIYDFDGTLFRSPHMPDWWPERGWWGNTKSLSPPCVPERPDSSWWNQKVFSSAKKSIANPNVHAIVCTGRLNKKFRPRLESILKGAGLRFDGVHLNTGRSTSKYKCGVIKKLCAEYDIGVVQVWEDRHLDVFKSYVEDDLGLMFVGHLQKENPKEVQCDRLAMEASIASDSVYEWARAHMSNRRSVRASIKELDEALDLKQQKLHRFDLRGTDLSEYSLAGLNLHNSRLTGAKFIGLYGDHTDLTGSKLTNCKLIGVDMSGLTIERAKFGRSDLTGSVFRGTTFVNCNFNKSLLSKCDFRGAIFEKCTFNGAVLDGSTFVKADLSGCSLNDCTAINTSFWSANLDRAKMKNCDLTRAYLAESSRVGTKLDGTDLSKANN